MEYFSSNAPYAPTKPSYFSPTEMLYFHLVMLAMALFSALLHIAFVMCVRKLWGVGARSAYLVLGAIAGLGISNSFVVIGSDSLALIGLKWNDCIIVWRALGGIFIATVLSMNLWHFLLLLQRIVCIFFPTKVEHILRHSVVQVFSFLALLFYVAVVAICLTPLAGAAYVPEHGTFTALLKLPYSSVLMRASNLSNYVVTLSNIIAYPLLLLFLKFKLNSRSSKEELRLTSQVALSVAFEVVFYVTWEFFTADGATLIIIYAISNLWYYNAVTLPYFIMNKRVHEEMKRLLFAQKHAGKLFTITKRQPSTHEPVVPYERR